MLAQITPAVSASEATSRQQFAVISFGIIKRLHRYCSRSEIIVYNALALHADPEGHCWPGRARLAAITDLSETRVSKATAGLEKKGLLRKEYPPGGRVDYWLLDVAPTATPPRDRNGTPPVTETAPEQTRGTDQRTERATEPEPDPPSTTPSPPEPIQPALSECRLQVRSLLPADWQLPAQWRDWANEQRPDLAGTLEAIAANFADFHSSKGTRSSCWIAEWRRWIRRERSPKTIKQAHPNTPSDRRYPTPEQEQAPVPAAIQAALERSHQAYYDLCRSQGIDPTTGLRIDSPAPPLIDTIRNRLLARKDC